ncbi:MAG: serine/threonine-protein kinase [Planctomycetota bacterium]
MLEDAQTIAKGALSLPPAERSSFLTRSCAGDDALRSRVDRMIGMMESRTLVPDTPSAATPIPVEDEPVSERWIGRYRVIDAIGSGTMGVVYVAEQQTPKRRIALKVIRPDVVTDALRDRFEQETRVLARLKHPAIAQIYDAGSARVDGRDCPYFAMELVTGDALDTHAEHLPLRARLEMLRAVCAGVEHAHQRGVVHRDLKPANILVDDQGRPRVLDFGVARALDSEAASRAELVGTLPYMSPEQLRADPDTDTRADVYALGVILCELVAGTRPHDLSGVAQDDAASHLERTPPAPLRELDPSAPRDLEAIASRALARDPDDRYQSAAALSDDLGRYLRKEPVDARTRTPAYVATRFTQRNTGVVTLGVVGLLAIAGGVAGVSWQAVEATRGWARADEEAIKADLERARAEKEAVEADRQRARAEEAAVRAERERARATEEAQRVRAINAFFTDMLSSADPENALGEELTVRELLDTAARVDTRGLEEVPAVESTVRLAIANTYRSLGVLDDAIEQGRAAVDAATRAHGTDDPLTADAMQTLAFAHIERGDHAEAERLLDETVAILTRTIGPDRLETIGARGELARVYHETGRPEEALALWTRCLADARAFVENKPDTVRESEMKTVLTIKHNYGSALGAMGRYEEAEAVLSEVIDERVRIFGASHPQTVGARSMLASYVQQLGRNEEAAEQFRAILDARTEILGADHHSTHTARGNLAVPLIALGELEEAERLNREALEGLRSALPEGHAKILILMSTRAYLLEDMGRDAEAEALYREQIVLRERASGGNDPATWSSYNNLAMLLQRTGRPGEAIEQYEKLLAMCRGSLPEGHIYTALFENNYGACLTDLGRTEEAREALERSHAVIVATFPEGHARVRTSQERLAAIDD